MTYAKITIKCNYEFIKEINSLIAEYDGYVKDFFEQVKKEAFTALEAARERNDPDCNISAEVTLTCPCIIWDISTDLLQGIPEDCSDVYYMLTQIAAIPKNRFVA
jgi:hypothetical protein